MIEINPNGAMLAAAADLHHTALPGSTISRLGSSYTRAFYRYARACKSEAVFVARDECSNMLGAAVLTVDPIGLTRRLALRTPLVLHVMLRPWFALQVVRELMAEHASEKRSAVPKLPEVLAIFIDQCYRSRGIGAELLRAVETYLRAHSYDRYVVRTLAGPNNRAVAFYEREGFKTVGRFFIHGHWFQYMVKDISNTADGRT